MYIVHMYTIFFKCRDISTIIIMKLQYMSYMLSVTIIKNTRYPKIIFGNRRKALIPI